MELHPAASNTTAVSSIPAQRAALEIRFTGKSFCQCNGTIRSGFGQFG
jgi:hypothetical protein